MTIAQDGQEKYVSALLNDATSTLERADTFARTGTSTIAAQAPPEPQHSEPTPTLEQPIGSQPPTQLLDALARQHADEKTVARKLRGAGVPDGVISSVWLPIFRARVTHQ